MSSDAAITPIMPITLVSPLAALPDRVPTIPAPRPAGLDGRTVHLILSMPHGSGFEPALAATRAAIAARYPNAAIVEIVRHERYMGDDPAQRDAIATAPEPCAIYFGSPTGALNLVGADYCARLEAAGVPTAMIVPGFAMPAVTHAAHALACPLAFVEAREDVAGAAIAALLAPAPVPTLLTAVATRAAASEAAALAIARDEHWDDGLPIVLPTAERVATMLEDTRQPADAVVSANLGPHGRIATVERVAANAVMAGARAKDLPLLLAATQAFGINPAIRTMLGSVNGFCFPFVVNGPIRQELGLETGYATLDAHAHRAIERALRLIVQNVVGVRPGLTAFPVQGHPAGTSFLIVENEEASPWPPFVDGGAVERSHLSLFGGGWSHIGTYFYPEEGLDLFAAALARLEMPHSALVLLSPSRAALLAHEFPDKLACAEAIRQKATVSLGDFRRSGYYAGRVRDRIRTEGTWPEDYLEGPDTVQVPAYPRDGIKIVVSGSDAAPIITAWKLEPLATASPDDWR